MGESSSENSTPHSGVSIDTGSSSLEEVLVHIDKALKEDFEPYRNGVESVIRDVVKKGMMRVDVKFRFIDGLPLSVPFTHQVGKGDPTIRIPLQCVLRIFLPKINEERFLFQKERLLRAFPSLLGCKRIEKLPGSCDVTLSGIDFIKFVSDFHNPRGLVTFIQIDPCAEIQFGIRQPVKVSRLLRQSSLLMPVTKAFSSIERFCNETAKRHAETFRSRCLSAYYSLDVAEECLESGLRGKKLKCTLEETEKLQSKPSSAAKKLFRIKEMVDKDFQSALKSKQQIETLKGILSSTIRKIEMKRHFAFACSSGNADFAKKLIDSGVNVNEAGENGRFPLEEACHSNHLEIGRMLINSGANINKEDKFGRFPLLAACEKGNIEIARLLITSRANVNQANKIRRFALASACSVGHFELAKLLINAGGDVNLSDEIGCDSLLPVACSSGQSNLVELLLENGCNPNSRNQLGKSALLCACSRSHYAIGTLVMNSSISLDSSCYQPVVETIIRQHTLVREISSDALSIVKMILSRSPGLAALRDENGRFSHELPCPTELKEVLICFWAQYQYRERYAQGTVKSKQVMICVLGEAGARRTTLVQSLDAKSASGKSSVEITAVNALFADKIFVVDFAGQAFFHKMHTQLFSSSSTIFFLVVDLSRSEEEQRRASHCWLSFVKCCVRLPAKAIVVVCDGDIWAITRKCERLVAYLRATFSQWFVFIPSFSSGSINVLSGLRLAHRHLCNAVKSVPAIFETVQQTFLPILRNPKSASASPTLFRKFGNLVLAASSRYRLTQNLRQNVFRALKRIIPNSNELSDFLPIQCIDAKRFKKLAVESVCAGLSERDQDRLVSFLQATGEILVIDDTVVIDLPWVCRRGINSLFSISSSNSPIHFDTGTASRESIQIFFERTGTTKFSRFMIQLLCSLELCYPVDEQASCYFFPALIQEGFPPHVWRENRIMTVYVGRRLMSEEKTDIIPPETMPLIQLNARNAPCFRTSQIIVWRGGLAIEQTINRYLVEGIVVVKDAEKAIDFIVRGPPHSEGQCKKHLSDLMAIGTRVLQEKPFRFSLFYISCADMKKHKDFPCAHKSETIERITRISRYSSATVSSGNDVKDSLEDLLALPDDHFAFVPYEARHALCECLDKDPKGSSALARRLPGFSSVDRYQCKSAEQFLSLWSNNLDATIKSFVDSARELSLLYLLVILHDCGSLEFSLEEEKAARKDLAFLEANPPSAIETRRLSRLLANSLYTSSASQLHLDAPVTDGERMKAAKLIQTVWRHIGRALGFQNDILNEIESSKGDNRDRALTMLDEWSDRHGNCAIRRHLIKAMMEEGYTTQVAEVFPGFSGTEGPFRYFSTTLSSHHFT